MSAFVREAGVLVSVFLALCLIGLVSLRSISDHALGIQSRVLFDFGPHAIAANEPNLPHVTKK